MGTRLTTESFIERAIQVHGTRYDYSKVKYVRSRDKVIIICKKHGSFSQCAASHLSGCGCPGCQKEWSDEHKANHAAAARKSRGMTTDEWVARAKSIHGNKYDYSNVVYVNQRTKVTIICPIHGEFAQKAGSHIRGFGCKKCGDESENHIGVHAWSDEQRAKIAATCIERYGAARYLDSENGKAKLSALRSNAEFRAKMRNIISSDIVQEKTKATCKSRYGVESAMLLPATVNKMQETKNKNNSWNTSKPEESMYIKLCDVFGESDIVRQYKDIRYPFRCDFYVRSLDLFIEFNGTWLHGKRWFDPMDSDCLSVLHNWHEKLLNGSRFYAVAIDVWTVRDVKKRQTAINNNLNFLAFWKNDLSDFNEWLESKPLLLNNILQN